MRRNIRNFLSTPARYVRAIEYVLSTATIAWGVLLALPPDVFAGVSWTALRESPLSEVAWGVLFTSLGIFKLVAVWRRWHAGRRWGAFAAMALWSGVGFSFLLINAASPGWAPYLFVFATLNALTFLRLSQRGVQ